MPNTDWDLDNLSAIEAQIWGALEEAANARSSAFRTPILATVRDNAPQARAVVLRRANRAELMLQSHTDRRSKKVQELRANPEVLWYFYDPEARIQLCARAHAAVHGNDDVARDAWAHTDVMARRCYLSTLTPGEEVPEKTSGLPEELEGKRPGREESEAGYKNFSVIRTRVHSIHWLLLRSRGNVAARFIYDGNGEFSATWVAP